MRQLWLTVAMTNAKPTVQIMHAIVLGARHIIYNTRYAQTGLKLCGVKFAPIGEANGWRVVWDQEAFVRVPIAQRCGACIAAALEASYRTVGVIL